MQIKLDAQILYYTTRTIGICVLHMSALLSYACSRNPLIAFQLGRCSGSINSLSYYTRNGCTLDAGYEYHFSDSSLDPVPDTLYLKLDLQFWLYKRSSLSLFHTHANTPTNTQSLSLRFGFLRVRSALIGHAIGADLIVIYKMLVSFINLF